MGNFNWTNRPTQIRKWEKDVDYVMFIDENGMSDITHILKKIMKGKKILEILEEKLISDEKAEYEQIRINISYCRKSGNEQKRYRQNFKSF